MDKRFLFWTVIGATALLTSSLPADAVPTVRPKIVRVLPHASHGFTQGLLYHNGLLYEGTGQYGKSGLFILELQNGKILQSIPLPNFFGEGIAVLKNRLFQLTWKAGRCLAYRFPSLELVDTLSYEGEGWGLATDGRQFIMSNGSDTLYFRNSSFKVLKSLPVTQNDSPVTRLNELEYANDRVYANVWYSRNIMEIDPVNGSVTREIDCSPLFEIEKPPRPENVFNGIAFNPKSGTFYLTGKNWKYLFEAAFPPVE